LVGEAEIERRGIGGAGERHAKYKSNALFHLFSP
jgi:hypothetical protein